MNLADLKTWVNNLTEEDLTTPLTPYLMLKVGDPKMADALDEFLGTMFINAPLNVQMDAMRLLVLLHIPI